MEAENDIDKSSDTSSVSDNIPNDDIASPDPVEDTVVSSSNKTFFGEDDRSQTPLQDEVEGASQQVADIAGRVQEVEISEVPQQTSQQDTSNADASNRSDNAVLKQSMRDDHGELDYDEEVQPDGCPVASTNGGSPANTHQKAVAEEEKEDGEEKEEGEELEEGEADDAEKSTDGEIDDDDCEDGEIKDPGGKKPFVRPICRFFMRGNCTWGMSCRFLHPGINDKGNYTMLEQQPPPPPFMPPMYPGMYPPPMIGPGGRPMPPPPWMHDGMPYRMPRAPVDMGPPVMEPPEPASAAPAPSSEPATESAWERGLRHAKEMRKKQKEIEVSGDEKKEDDEEEKKPPSPVRDDSPPPPPQHFDMPARPPGHDEGDTYGRPPMPPPAEMWGYRPPFDAPFDPRWGRGMPPPFMPPPPDFRLPEHERARRYSPHGSRYDPRRNPWYDRYPHDGPGREPGGPHDAPSKGRADEWKDPWLRSRSPKRRRSSSRSGSRGRHRYRKGSYSSLSSSSYSSKSRSRSSSVSSYSSYSRSSSSRSSYSSRSSSSRSRSRVHRKPRKPVVSTFRRPLPDKKTISSTANASSETKSVSQSETLLIGSGPLPARAPPEKKTPAATQPAVVPKVSHTPPVTSAGAAVVSVPQPVMAPAPVPAPVPPPAKPVVASTSLPKLTQPLPLASRPPPANVARGVAAAFLEQDDDDTETTDAKTSTGISALVAQNSVAAKKVETGRTAASKVPAPVPPPATCTVTTPGKSVTTKSDLMMGLSGMSYSDMVLAAQMQKTASVLPYDRGDGKGLGHGHSHARTSERHASAKKSHPSGRQRPSRDSKGRKKLEIGRNVIGRPLSSSRSRSSSSGSHASLSSLSTSGESEHLYRDIASDISSASSPAASPGHSVSDKPKTAKTKGLTTPQSSLGSSRMLASAQPKSHHAEKTKEKLRSSGRGGHRPKTHDGARREHRTSHHSHLPRAGVSSDGLRAGPKEIPHEVVRDREQEVQPVPAGHAGVHPHREGTRRHSGSFGGHKPITKHAEEFRSKPVPGQIPLSASHRLSSDQRPLAGHGSADAKLGSGAKGEPKVSAKADKTVSQSQSVVPSAAHKRVSTFDEMPVTKVMRHASELKEPVKIPIPKFDRTQKPATATSPVRSSARPNQPPATALVAMATARSPAKASLSLPLHPLSKPALMHPSLTAAAGLKRKSTSSRREELLMQLKAVEDAIAKKRSKMQ